MYDYIHGICYYENLNRNITIETQINNLKKLKHSNNNINILCIIGIMSDEPYLYYKNNNNISEKDIINYKIKKNKDFEKYRKLQNENITIDIVYFPNWGGTIGFLWQFYKKYIDKNIYTAKYICIWEDDHIPNKENWYDIFSNYIISNDLTYIGSIKPDFHKKYLSTFIKNGYKHVPKEYYNIFKRNVPNIELEYSVDKLRWTDGCPYFFDFNKLKDIENKIGRFIPASYLERYNHSRHGVILGEVGFPTRLFHNNFKYKGFDIKIYIKPIHNRTINYNKHQFDIVNFDLTYSNIY